jgi:hypothetical protein
MKYILSMAALAAATALPATAAPIMFYDGQAGGAPESQGWLSYANYNEADPNKASMATTAGGKTTIDTTGDVASNAYYSNLDEYGDSVHTPPAELNESQGYTLSFTGTMFAESHAANPADRTDINAGWTLIAISSDRQAIQIGFRGDQVFGVNGSQDEDGNASMTFNNVTATPQAHTFDLNIRNSQYTLYADGDELISGATFDADINDLGGFASNSLYFGDLSATADVNYELSSFSLAVPEPWAICPIVLGLALLVRPRRRRA